MDRTVRTALALFMALLLQAVHADTQRFPLAECAAAEPLAQAQLEYLLQSYGA